MKKQWRLVIFDMDGLMFDTERVSFLSFTKAFASYGYALDEVTFRRTIAANMKKVKEVYLERFGPQLPFEEIVERKFAFAAAHVQENGVPVKPGLYELLDFLAAKNIKTAVATSSNRAIAWSLLQMAGVAEKFDTILCGDEISHSKPDPEIFLKAAEKLGCDPCDCLVLEDAGKGILAAHRAGMQSILVPDLVEPDEETAKLAFRIMPSLHEVRVYLAAESDASSVKDILHKS